MSKRIEINGRTIRVIFETPEMAFGYSEQDPLKKQFYRKDKIAAAASVPAEGETLHDSDN